MTYYKTIDDIIYRATPDITNCSKIEAYYKGQWQKLGTYSNQIIDTTEHEKLMQKISEKEAKELTNE